MKFIHPPSRCIFFIYTLHFSLVHSQTVLGVLYVLYMLSVFFDLRCESVTFIIMVVVVKSLFTYTIPLSH